MAMRSSIASRDVNPMAAQISVILPFVPTYTTLSSPANPKMRLMRDFGFAGLDSVVYVGTNGKMTEICAAMGLTSLDAIDDLIAINRRNYLAYCAALSEDRTSV